jgi:hypothetical protein
MLSQEACLAEGERTGLLLQVTEYDLLGIGEGGAQDLVVEPVAAQRFERCHLGPTGRGRIVPVLGLAPRRV